MSSVCIRRLRLEPLRIPFTVAFRHASADRSETSSLWVEAVSDLGTVGFGESCPRPHVTGETLDSAHAFFSRHEASLRDRIVDLDSLAEWSGAHADELEVNPAAWCAIELAILDLLAKESGRTLEAFLFLPPLQGRFRYSAVLGDSGPDAFRKTAERYYEQGFTDFKLKLAGRLDRDREKIAVLRHWDGVRVRVDANNLWASADEAIAYLQALDYPLFAVEEPLRPNQYDELARMATELNCKVILDESFLRVSQLKWLRDKPDRWLINLRVSKMGGLFRSLVVVEAARAARVGLVIGAQVGETSLLTRVALTVAEAARDLLVAQEGAFGTFLLERDVCDPPVMFGVGGVLDVASYPALGEPGIGLTVTLNASHDEPRPDIL
jgi:L-alanine-DL-glutamate epimerase-like enolase superfamily enzyme